jgi:hypothetical protein
MPSDFAHGRNQRVQVVIAMMHQMLIKESGMHPQFQDESASAQMSAHLAVNALLH